MMIHRDRLGVIANARKSHRLKTFLKTGDRGGGGTGDGGGLGGLEALLGVFM